jgi:CRISPR/Cas system-associated endonuclease Cas1
MKKLLNTLFVTTQNAYLCHEGESVLVNVEKEVKLRVPIHTIGGIVCFGQVSCSPPLLWLCGERGVVVTYLTENGRFQARVEGPVSGNVLLRREQYRRSDDPKKTETGAVEMTDDTRKEVIMAYQKRKQEEITHPFLGENVRVGILFHCQALLLARYLRGDLDGYPPFLWK